MKNPVWTGKRADREEKNPREHFVKKMPCTFEEAPRDYKKKVRYVSNIQNVESTDRFSITGNMDEGVYPE